jgi:hypothetical protein
MPKGVPLSAAHKQAISDGLKRYWAGKKGSGGSSSGGSHGGGHRSAPKPSGGVSGITSGKAGAGVKTAFSNPSTAPRPIQHIETGKVISREAAARIMFGSAGSRKKAAGGKKVSSSSKGRKRK